ncbi:hypothetical protein D9M71_446760 [compost metagenome]
MAHETADDQVQVAQLLQSFVQLGVLEGVGHALFDDDFAFQRLQPRYELASRPLWVEAATDSAQVANMDDRTAALARGVEQPGDVGHGLVHARQLQGTTEVLLLRIDDDQAGVAQLGRRIVAASEAKHRGWNGHQGLLG